MKMPISEIADRYSIALLKKERANADNDQEINVLYQELVKYDQALNFVEKLKEINGQIWDLESDIRKGKENELGLEEVGRRAIAIRGLNKIRVSYKNEMVSIYGEGFEDIKMNHASA
jgi:tetratricopeptide (TPR) repeat protein